PNCHVRPLSDCPDHRQSHAWCTSLPTTRQRFLRPRFASALGPHKLYVLQLLTAEPLSLPTRPHLAHRSQVRTRGWIRYSSRSATEAGLYRLVPPVYEHFLSHGSPPRGRAPVPSAS